MKRHELKTWPLFFEEVWKGRKMFEVRQNDRGFKPWDDLLLREYDDATQTYTGRWITAKITYILYGPFPGMLDGACVMSIRPYQKGDCFIESDKDGA